MRHDRSASRDRYRRRTQKAEDLDAGAISDQKPRDAKIEGRFLRQADRRQNRVDRLPRNAGEAGPTDRDIAAWIGPAFVSTLPCRVRGSRSFRAAGTAARRSRLTMLAARSEERAGRRRCGLIRHPHGRRRRLAAAAYRRAGIGHCLAGGRLTRRQHRTHERRQGDPGKTRSERGCRHGLSRHSLRFRSREDRMIHSRRSTLPRQPRRPYHPLETG